MSRINLQTVLVFFFCLKKRFISKYFTYALDEETGCSVGDYTVSSRRRWNYENNCAAIVCYVSTGLASSSTQLTDLSDDIIQRHQQLAKGLTVDNVTEILQYAVNKMLRSKGVPSAYFVDAQKQSSNSSNSAEIRLPAIHLKVFYQVRYVNNENLKRRKR